MQITHIDHVGIAVADLDAAIELYEKSFGMRCVHTEVNEEQGVREAMLATAVHAFVPVVLKQPGRLVSAPVAGSRS